MTVVDWAEKNADRFVSGVCQKNQKSNMGARVTRFMKRPLETQRKVEKILENKPRPAPRYPSSKAALAKEQKSEYSKQISAFNYLC